MTIATPSKHQLRIQLNRGHSTTGTTSGAVMFGRVDARSVVLVEELLREHAAEPTHIEVELWHVTAMDRDALHRLMAVLVDGKARRGGARLTVEVRTREG